MMHVKLLTATGFGLGYIPLAPGTFGSLLGLGAHLLLYLAGGPAVASIGLLVVTSLGFWSAGAAERHFARRDPGHVVIDEIAGQMLTLAFLPLTAGLTVAGFLLFRLLDILKPIPARRMEGLPGASGIMADDLVAGLYANLILQALVRWSPWALGNG
jgi:phosphatidylglycerophosphatase A